MTKDDDDLFEKLEEMLENVGLDDRFDDVEEKIEELQEQQGGDSPFGGGNPFDGPFGGPFGGDGPFGGEDGPFGGDNPFGQDSETQQDPGYGLVSDVVEDGEEVVVAVDLPEFEEDQVEITADAERVRIEADATDDMYHDSVSQVFELPVEVEPSGADATYTNGFLRVTLPRVEPDDQTTISIE